MPKIVMNLSLVTVGMLKFIIAKYTGLRLVDRSFYPDVLFGRRVPKTSTLQGKWLRAHGPVSEITGAKQPSLFCVHNCVVYSCSIHSSRG